MCFKILTSVFFAMLLTLAQLTFMFSDTFDLIPPKGVNQGLPPPHCFCFWRIVAMLIKISTSGFFAGFINFYHF